MFSKLPDDIFDVAFIDQEIPQHHFHGVLTGFEAYQDFLLVLQGNLRIGNEEGRNQGMRVVAFPAQNPLYRELYQCRHPFHVSGIMAIPNQTSMFSTRAFDPVKWKTGDNLIIEFLRNLIAIFDENRYHSLDKGLCSFG